MGSFARLLPIILLHEGVDPVKNPTGYADIPGDPGGITKWGISTRAWTQLRGRHPRYAAFPAKVIELTRQQAESIYRWEYWEPIPAEQLPDSLALVIFDAAVNQGPGTAIQVLQRALRVTDDGDFGPKSTAALNAYPSDHFEQLREELLWQRLAEYQRDTSRDLMEAKRENRDSAFPRFLTHLWIPRLLKVRAEGEALT